MSKSGKHHISGRVVDRASGDGVSGLRVQAWDQDVMGDDRMGEATTGDDGAFEISFTEETYRGIFERRPDVFFRVYRGMALVHSTEEAVLWNVDDPLTGVTIEIDPPHTSPPRR